MGTLVSKFGGTSVGSVKGRPVLAVSQRPVGKRPGRIAGGHVLVRLVGGGATGGEHGQQNY